MPDEIPTEALEAAARAASGAFETWREPQRWQATPDQRRKDISDRWLTAVAAAAPYLIAEGRRQGERHALKAAEEAILGAPRPDAVLDTQGVVVAAAVVRRLAERIAEGTDHG